MKHSLAICLLGVAVIVGFSLTPPLESIDCRLIRLLDATMTTLLGVLVLGAFHLTEPVHYGKRWAMIRSMAIPLVWLLLVWILAAFFRYIHGEFYGNLFYYSGPPPAA